MTPFYHCTVLVDITASSFIAVIVLQLLGDPLLLGPDGPIRGRAAYRRRIALLSILAVARGRPVGRERLVGLLWPDHPADAARHTLSESLYVLRKELGEAAFLVVGDEVGLVGARVASDLDTFETALEEGRLDDAVRAYRGPFLAGFYVPGALEFERWAEGERDRLARAFAGALRQLAEQAEAAADPLAAAEWWRRVAAHDPFSSRVALRLARTLCDAGEHAAALRHAEAHGALLHQELGMGPDPELADFVERLRAERLPLPRPRPATPVAGAEQTDTVAGADRANVVAGADRADVVAGAEQADAGAVERGGGIAPDPAALVAGAAGDPAPPAGSTLSTAPAPAVPPADSEKPGGTVVATAWPRAVRRWRRRAAAAGVLALGATLLSLRRGALEQPPVPPGPDPRRVAVLYFDDDSPGGELGYLAGGLTEGLIHELSQVPALTVISRNGVKPYRGGTVPLDSVTARLGVGSVVEGSVQRAGDRVKVTVQLIDAATQAPVESRVVVKPLGDVLALESALADEVSGFLRRRLGRQLRLRALHAGTRSSRARVLVLRAEDAMEQAGTVAESRDSLDLGSSLRLSARADSLLAAAQYADPAWTLPLALRGRNALAAAGRVPAGEDTALLRRAREYADQLLRREPRNALALYVRGAAARPTRALGPGGTARIDAAERDLRAAVAADPSLAPAWGALAKVLLVRGRVAEARMAAERALAADAWLEDRGILLRGIFFAALEDADYATARDACQRGARAFPGDWNFVECQLTLLREDRTRPPDPALAWRLVAELDRLYPPARARAAGRAYAPFYRRMVAAGVSARAGDAARARAELARARALAGEDTAVTIPMAYDAASVLLALGDTSGARARLEEYLGARPALRPLLARDPLFQELEGGRGPLTRGSR